MTAARADPEQQVHVSVISAIGNLAMKPQVSIPALVGVLRRTDTSLHYRASLALGEFGSAAASAIPLLVEEFKSGDGLRKSGAATALWKIDSKKATQMGLDPNPGNYIVPP